MVVLTFDEALDISADDLPPGTAFTLQIGATVTSVDEVTSNMHDKLMLKTSQTIVAGQIVEVWYSPATGQKAIEDPSGNKTAAFEHEVTNNSLVPDTTVPRLTNAQVPASGETLSLLFDEALDISATDVPAASAFTVTVDGEERTPDAVRPGADQFELILELTPLVEPGETVTVSYTVPTSGKVIEDASGNDAAAFTNIAVDNRSEVDITGPVLEGAEVLAQGNLLTLTFDEDLDVSATDLPPASAFTVKADDADVSVQGVQAPTAEDTGHQLILELGTEIERTRTVTVSYAVPDAGKVIEDARGNDALAFEDEAVVNSSAIDTIAPTLKSAEVQVSGDILILVFDEDLDITATDLPEPRAFTVKTGRFEVAVDSIVALTGLDRFGLALERPIYTDETVTVSYTKPESGKAIEDRYGNAAADFADAEVTNLSDSVNPKPALTQPTGKPRVFGGPPPSKSTTVLHVQWAIPLNLDPVWVDSYDVRYRKEGASTWLEGPQGVVERQALIEGLESGTAYEVEVRMTNTNTTADPDGNSPWSRTGTGATRTPGTPYAGDLQFAPGTMTTVADTNNDGVDEDEGRLEVYHAQRWGTVCDDRFGREQSGGQANVAPRLACRIMGYADGVYADGYGQFTTDVNGQLVGVPATRQNPIWLDDVVCHAGSTHWTGSPPVKLDHCYNAGGWDLHNCTHGEDAGVRCWGTIGANENVWDAPGARQEQALTAGFEDVPAAHDGATAFTVRLALSEDIANSATDLKDHAIEVSGGTVEGVAQIDGRADLWEATIAPAGTDDVVVSVAAAEDCAQAGALCTAGGLALSQGASVTVEGPGVTAAPFTAWFENAPTTHDGSTPFRIEIVFSELPHGTGGSPPAMTNSILKQILEDNISGGTIDEVRRINHSGAHRSVMITPDGDAEVRIALGPSPPCGEPLAICTADDRALATPISWTVPGPASAPAVVPLTARFVEVPPEHDGSTAVTLGLVFSEAFAISYRVLRNHAFTIAGGDVRRAKRVDNPHQERFGLEANREWRITVKPEAASEDIVLTLPATSDCAAAGAVCTGDGKRLSEEVSTRIPGPARLTVRDATVEEGPGAVLVFEVTLNRERHAPVSVDYATEDGTATVGDDYTATSGRLTFEPGETAKTVEVPVLDDAHDEGAETLVLRLSNAEGARIADGEATGTITNTDHMPQAWLARFGRTVGEQVLDAVEARMRAAPQPGTALTMAGQHLISGVPDPQALAKAEEKAQLEEFSSWMRHGTCRDDVLAPRDCPVDEPGESWSVTNRELLTGSSFAFTGGTPEGGYATLWGRGAFSRFDGREDELRLDGEVTSVMLGTDWTREHLSAGLILSHARGEGGYQGEDSGAVESTLTGLYPWGRYALNERVTVWGAAGYGAGTLVLTPEEHEPLETDMDLALVAGGLRGVLVEAPDTGGPELSLKSDMLAVRTSSDALADAEGGNLAAAQADVTRLRLGLEGAWRGLTLGSGTFEPRLELGVRHDGGDAETGFGLDFGAGLAWTDPLRGVRAELGGRGLLTHESSGFGDRGFAGSLVWDPAPDSDRGLRLSLSQTVGARASEGVDALLRPDTTRGLEAAQRDDLSRRHLKADLGYGIALFGGGWTGTPKIGLGWSQSVRETTLGWRLAEARRPGLVFGLDIEGARRTSAAGERSARAPSRARARVAARGRGARALRGPPRGRTARAGRREPRARGRGAAERAVVRARPGAVHPHAPPEGARAARGTMNERARRGACAQGARRVRHCRRSAGTTSTRASTSNCGVGNK